MLPPRTFSFCSSAEAAKALKSNCPTSRSKRTRNWLLLKGVQVANRRGLMKVKVFSLSASPDWLMVEPSMRRPLSTVRLSRTRQVPRPNTSPRVSSTLTEAEGRGTGTPPLLKA
ncbi:hypothetical protein D3C85_1445430 [compost metagenome]